MTDPRAVNRHANFRLRQDGTDRNLQNCATRSRNDKKQ